MFLAPQRQLRNTTFAALDLETTSVSCKKCHVIEIAIKRFEGGNTSEQTFHRILRPPGSNTVPRDVAQFTGLDFKNRIWDLFPSASSIRSEVASFLRDAIIVHHSTNNYDLHVTKRVFKLPDSFYPIYNLNTLFLAKELFSSMEKGHKLENIAYQMGVKHDKRARTALGDVEVTRLILLEYLRRYKLEMVSDLKETELRRAFLLEIFCHNVRRPRSGTPNC